MVKVINNDQLVAKRNSDGKALLSRDMFFEVTVLRWTIQQSLISHVTIYHHFTHATSAGQMH